MQGGGRERRGREGGGRGTVTDPHSSSDRRSVKHIVAARSAKSSKTGSVGGMPIHYVVLPALLLGGVAVTVYFGGGMVARVGGQQAPPTSSRSIQGMEE